MKMFLLLALSVLEKIILFTLVIHKILLVPFKKFLFNVPWMIALKMSVLLIVVILRLLWLLMILLILKKFLWLSPFLLKLLNPFFLMLLMLKLYLMLLMLKCLLILFLSLSVAKNPIKMVKRSMLDLSFRKNVKLKKINFSNKTLLKLLLMLELSSSLLLMKIMKVLWNVLLKVTV